jgi:hypothetical protein
MIKKYNGYCEKINDAGLKNITIKNKNTINSTVAHYIPSCLVNHVKNYSDYHRVGQFYVYNKVTFDVQLGLTETLDSTFFKYDDLEKWVNHTFCEEYNLQIVKFRSSITYDTDFNHDITNITVLLTSKDIIVRKIPYYLSCKPKLKNKDIKLRIIFYVHSDDVSYYNDLFSQINELRFSNEDNIQYIKLIPAKWISVNI